jgi:hypothetical protein
MRELPVISARRRRGTRSRPFRLLRLADPAERDAGEAFARDSGLAKNGDRIFQSADVTGERNFTMHIAGSGNVVG